MFNPFKRHKPVLISRGELSKLIFRQCGSKVHHPLDKKYRLVSNHRWLLNRTPIFSSYQIDYNDCNHLACLAMAKMQSHCVGMAIIATSDHRLDHCVNIVCMEDLTIQLYDPSPRTLKPAVGYKIKRIWL